MMWASAPPSPSELTPARLPVHGIFSVATYEKQHFCLVDLLALWLPSELKESNTVHLHLVAHRYFILTFFVPSLCGLSTYKPTHTDIIVPNDSCHPSAIKYLINRVNTCSITKEAKKKEITIIHNILRNNKYDNKTLNMAHQKPQKQKENTDIQQLKEKWATFTYHRKLTQLCKDTHIKIAFKTKNPIQNTLKPYIQKDKYEKNGVYQMKCTSCPKKYIGQTGRPFNTRYKEYIRDIKNNTGYSY
jgi:hypothetical protein